MTEENRQARALFRYGLISEFLHTRMPRRQRRQRMRELARRKYEVPWQDKRLKVSMSTLSRWLGVYRDKGFEGLVPTTRSDKGACKAIDPVLAQRIVAVKEATQSLSIPELIRSLEDAGEAPPDLLKHSTVHRLLQRHGISGRPGKDRGLKPQRLPFNYPDPMDLWMGDVMHGRVEVAEQKVYLIAFLDDATRAVMHAAFSFDEGAMSVLEVLRQALMTRGCCKRLYVDHGSAFVDSRLVRTCAHLGVHLLHAPVGDGAAKGGVERWFARFRSQCERYLRPADLTDLDTLNSLLWRWIHSTYHQRAHSALDGQAPWETFMSRLADIDHRRVDPDFDFEALWRRREERTVRRDGTVSLLGHQLEVPPTVTRGRVELRFMNEKLPDDVEVWVDERRIGVACPVDLEANTTRRRWHPKSPESGTEALPLDPLGRARSTWQPDNNKPATTTTRSRR